MKALIIYIKKHLIIGVFIVLGIETVAIYAQEMMPTTTANYTTFELPSEKNITTDLERLTPEKWKTHPDYGYLPYYAPCSNCVELIQKRTDSTRYFIENNTNGQKVYLQTGDHTMHFRDKNGFIRERINLMLPTKTPHVFKTISAPQTVEVNINNQQVAIYIDDGQKVTFNKKLELWAVTPENKQILLNKATWKNGYNAGKNGVQVKEIFPNIDMEINILQEGIKTNFIVKNNNDNFGKYRYIFIKDDFLSEVATNVTFIGQPNEDKLYYGNAIVYNADNKRMATVEKGVMFDYKQSFQKNVFYEWKNGFNIYVETDIFNATNVVYPIVIDPTVQLTSTLPVSSMSGSKYDATCWNPNEYCSYDLNVSFPANVSFTDVKVLAGFSAPVATPSCFATGGAMRVTTGGCTSPHTSSSGAPPPYFWKCAGDPYLFNACHFSPATSIFASLSDCLPPPACNIQTQIFSLQLFRCVQPNNGCASNCIKAYEPFIITIVGETIDINSISLIGENTSTTICQGDEISLQPNQQYGVPTYSYLWTPDGQTSNSITVSPQQTTNYSVTVTDLCGNAKTASKTIIVKPVSNVTIGDTICEVNLPYSWKGQTVTDLVSPTSLEPYHILYDTVLQNGCPNITKLQLTVHPSVFHKIDTAVCKQVFPFVWNGINIVDVGQYLYKTFSEVDCDSMVTLNVSQMPNSVVDIDSSICEQYLPFTWNGQILTQGGKYTHIETADNGCDSITTLSLNVKFTKYETIKEKIYEEDLPVVWFQNNISDVGVYIHKDTLIASNSCDSILTTELTVETIRTKELFFVPNSFTPQGDGYNEIFLPTITEGVDVQKYVFEIYNRWGHRIFYTTDPNKGWNGEINGQIVEQGLYTWRMLITGTENTDKQWIIGHVNVVR